MRVTVNSQTRDIPEGMTLEALLRELRLEGRPCAAEVNRSLVPKRSHATHALKDGDVIELVTLVGGG
jgi:sulfur carrier protein